MSIMNDISSLTDDELLEIADNFNSATDYLKSIGMSDNGRYTKVLNDSLKRLNLEWLKKPNKYKIIEKVCPVCGVVFKTKNDSKETTTCGRSCSNTFFRSGINHGNYTGLRYRTKCFTKHRKECVICGESVAVDVHHLDGDRDNDDIYNLIPLCPTHHRYWHSKNKHLIEKQVIEYIENFRKLG